MTQRLLLLLLCIGFSVPAQNELTTLEFDTHYYEAVDQWVAFPRKEASNYHYGFVYIDAQAGFTFNYESQFALDDNGLTGIPKDSLAMIKHRLQPNTVKVAVLNEAQREALQLPEIPDWLEVYKSDDNDVAYLKSIGYHYNHVGACELALTPLLKAYDIEPQHEGLEFELAYAYNHLGRFDDAIKIITKAINNDPQNFYLFRELGFAMLYSERVEEAEKVYRASLTLAKTKAEKAEVAINMAAAFFRLQDRTKFDEWAKLVRTNTPEGSRFAQYIDHFEKEWGKQKE